MILQAIGLLLPLAVAMAISSVPIMAVLMILLSPHSRRSSIAYLSGWVVGIVALALLFSAGAMAVPETTEHGPTLGAGIIQIIIGVALEIFAIILFRHGDRNALQEMPKWLRAVSSVRPIQAFGFGVGLNLRPKSLLLTAVVGVVLSTQQLGPAGFIIALTIYTVICASTVAAPVIYALVKPEQAQPQLQKIRDWVTQNNRIITILVMVIVGVVVIGHGLTLL